MSQEMAGRRGGGGSGTQKFVYQKWPYKIFSVVNFVFPTMVTLVRGGGGGAGHPLPMVYGHSNPSLVVGPCTQADEGSAQCCPANATRPSPWRRVP